MKVGVVGSGPAGYLSALLLARKNFEVTLFEEKEVGGVCLNRGCVPTKHLLAYAKAYQKAKEFGLDIKGASIQSAVEHARKGADFFRQSVEKMLEKEKVNLVRKKACVYPGRIIKAGEDEYYFDYLVLATGSRQAIPEAFKDFPAVSGEDFLSFSNWEKVVVVGAGAQGIEMASFFALMGKEVILVEAKNQILPVLPSKIASLYEARIKKLGIKVLKGRLVNKAEQIGEKSTLVLDNGEAIEGVDRVILTAGRVPNTESVFIEEIKDEKGFIKVDEYLRTAENGVYACGDCINTPALAYTAYAEAEVVAKNIAGENAKIDYSLVPYAVFGHPEIAWIGLLEGEEIRVQSGVSARAMAELENNGFTILYQKDGVLQGGVIVSLDAPEAIHLIELFLLKGDLEKMYFIHPSFTEVIGEAFFKYLGKSRHA